MCVLQRAAGNQCIHNLQQHHGLTKRNMHLQVKNKPSTFMNVHWV